MEVTYAYCDHCGAEYNEEIFLPYITTTASGDVLRCLECNGEITNFHREEEDNE